MPRRTAVAVTILFALAVFASTAQAQMTCSDAQIRFNAIEDARRYGDASHLTDSWAEVQKAFGNPGRADENKPSAGSTTLTYSLAGCDFQFIIGSTGKVSSKSFALRASALGTPAPSSIPSVPISNTSPASLIEMSTTIASMERTLAQLQQQVQTLQKSLTSIKAQLPASTGAAPEAKSSTAFQVPSFSLLAPIETPTKSPVPSTSQSAKPSASTASTSTPAAKPACSESGSCYGDISDATGKPKTVYVPGYTRKDGTYVRGYYRSK